ncbi:MAG: decaprenyl-phosphate phosphoribosyltransferase [Prevotellaceae bacterium]|jgi:4-hydroxybenzoate polyprenyltransferase|nr:decaprenyl-phosphate phosphoribosyltransferase [Prevotellaceae bacterium]
MQIPVKSILLLLRPYQWLKNLFVFSPLFFCGQLAQWNSLYLAAIVFIAYSLMASSIYCFNDIRDIEADRVHPEKCSRPLASGTVSVTTAYFMMLALFFLAIAVMYFFLGTAKWKVIGITGIYYLLNIAYCIKLKHIAIVDIFIISTGFVLRVFAGGCAAGIYISHWIILMTFLLALFLTFAKRRDDVVIYAKTDIKVRLNINRYSLEFINQAISIIASVTIVCYLMYTVSAEVIAYFQTSYLYVTSIFVIAGIIRYMQLTIVDVKSGSPTKVLLKDKFIQLCVIAWIITFFVIIYF